MTSFWSETWDVAGSSWSSEWFTGGAGSATAVGGRGRLTSGAGAFSSHRGRLVDMDDVVDSNVLLSFTPGALAEQYLTVGVRTNSNGAAPANEAVAPHGMYVQVYDFLGPGVWLFRFGYDNLRLNLVNTTTGLPASFAAGTTYRVRFLVQGRRLRVRVWAAASAEPGTWVLDYTDPDAYLEPGKVTVGYTTGGGGTSQFIDVDDLSINSLDPVLPGPVVSSPEHVWSAFSRAANYAPDVALPISSASVLRKHMGVDTAVVETGFTPERWLSLQSSRGVVLSRDGVQEFTGMVSAREQVWDASSGQMRIKVEAVGDEQHFADRLVFPDPLRAADDQTVNDYWMTRTGATATAKLASTAMWQLISDQAGPTCRADRRVSGLVMGADPGVGLSRIWSGLFTSAGDNGVLDQLTNFSNVSGQNLGVRCRTAPGSLTVDIVQPRNLGSRVRFSASLRNLVGYAYREEAPTATHAVAAGQGDLHLRLRKLVVTGSGLALAWGRQIWKYLDRRDTADTTELTKEATDAVTEGDAKVSLAVTLTDSQAATYRTDWDLGDVITIYVAPPGYATSVTVTDVVREVLLEVDDKGAEKVTPAVGTPSATALPRSPTQKQLATVGTGLAGLKARK